MPNVVVELLRAIYINWVGIRDASLAAWATDSPGIQTGIVIIFVSFRLFLNALTYTETEREEEEEDVSPERSESHTHFQNKNINDSGSFSLEHSAWADWTRLSYYLWEFYSKPEKI